MAARDEQLAKGKLFPCSGRVQPVSVYSGHVADVVTIRFQPTDGGNLYPEKEILRSGVNASAVTGGDGPVVAYLVSTAVAGRAAAAIKIVAMPSVVGVPGGVARLKNDVVRGFIVTNDKRDMVLTERAYQQGDIDPGDCAGRHSPSGGHAPVACVNKPGIRR